MTFGDSLAAAPLSSLWDGKAPTKRQARERRVRLYKKWRNARKGQAEALLDVCRKDGGRDEIRDDLAGD